jgi:hypothetical protein
LQHEQPSSSGSTARVTQKGSNEFIVVERRGAVHCSEVDGGFEGSKKYWHVTKHFAAAVRIVDEDGGKNGLCRGIERCSGVGDDRDRVSG